MVSEQVCAGADLQILRAARSQRCFLRCACGLTDFANSNPLPNCEATLEHTSGPYEVVVVIWFRQPNPSLCRAYTHPNRIQGVIARMMFSMSRFASPSVLSWSRCTSIFEQYAAYSSSSSQNSARKASPLKSVARCRLFVCLRISCIVSACFDCFSFLNLFDLSGFHLILLYECR